MSEKNKLNKKIDDLVEGLNQQQEDEIYRSLSKMIDVISAMKPSGTPSRPISPSPTAGTSFNCPKCSGALTVT